MPRTNEQPYMTPEQVDPTEVALTATPHRPRRGELHGADDPEGWRRGRFASIRTVRREP
jgi:hypothetical protein